MYSLGDLNQEIRLKFECVVSDIKKKFIHSETRKAREPVSESSALEIKLDIDELQELDTLCTRLSIRTFISQLIIQLETMRTKVPYCFKSNLKEGRKWSDIVAGRNSHVAGSNKTVTHNIETVITSRPSHFRKETQRMNTNKITQPPTVKKVKKKLQIRKPRIAVIGDSHARGVAGEMLHQSNGRLNPMGYVKPNAGLSELINTAKGKTSKLTRRDTLIMIGGVE